MPLLSSRRREIIIFLDGEYQALHDRHYKLAPRGLPIGGEGWMDTFFRMEGVRGIISALRRGMNLSKAVKEGEQLAEIAVIVWNGRREWQVHRWEKTAHTYLDSLMRRAKNANTTVSSRW